MRRPRPSPALQQRHADDADGGGKVISERSALRTRHVGSSTIKPRQGLRLTAVAGDAPFADEHLAWARDAIELAQQSGQAAFTGRPSPHWLDCHHFWMLLSAAVGNPSVRQYLPELDGCTGSRAQTRIAAQFLRRPVADLNATEAAALLAACQAATKPPKARALRPLGPDAVISAGWRLASMSGVWWSSIGRPAHRSAEPLATMFANAKAGSKERPGNSGCSTRGLS